MMSLSTPNTWLYAKEWRYCENCKLLRPAAQLVETMNIDTMILTGEFICKDLAECLSFQQTGHGLEQWPVSKTAGERHAEMSEPPRLPVDPIKGQGAEEEFWGDN